MTAATTTASASAGAGRPQAEHDLQMVVVAQHADEEIRRHLAVIDVYLMSRLGLFEDFGQSGGGATRAAVKEGLGQIRKPCPFRHDRSIDADQCRRHVDRQQPPAEFEQRFPDVMSFDALGCQG